MISSSANRSSIDWVTFILYAFLVMSGLMMLHAVDRPPDGYGQDLAAMLNTVVGQQAVWLLISMAAWFMINLLVDRSFWVLGAYPIYIFSVVLLVAVLLFGKEINNATSWFSLFGFTFQPGEFAKFGACLAMAAYLSQWTEKLNQPVHIFTGVMIWAIPAGLIILQPDPGTSLVFISFLLVMYREGLPGILLVFGGFTAAMFLLGITQSPTFLTICLLGLLMVLMSFSAPRRPAWWLIFSLSVTLLGILLYRQLENGWPVVVVMALSFTGVAGYHTLRKNFRLVVSALSALVWGVLIAFMANFTFNNFLLRHQKERIDAWLRPEGMNEQGALYNIVQSKLAISGGGLTGKGLYEGTMTKYDYVPAQETDFIFSVVGEGEGFLGVAAVILGFLALLWRISVLAERQNRTFARAYAYGVAGIIFLHMLVNIGMTMGLMPVIGIPLPFMSKGGSSLFAFTIMIAVLLKLDRHRNEV